MVQPDRPLMTIYITAHEVCMRDNEGYRQTLRICNTTCFPTATVVTRKPHNIAFICALPVLFIPYSVCV